MGWGQVATILVTVVAAMLTCTLYSSLRAGDVRSRSDDLGADMNARFAQVDARFVEVHGRLAQLREDLREIRGVLQEALRTRAP